MMVKKNVIFEEIRLEFEGLKREYDEKFVKFFEEL